VFDLAGVPRQEIKNYARHIRLPEWSPLHLPEPWERLPAHPDSAEGIAALRKGYIVVTCSNGPLGLLAKLSKFNGISWDAIIPLEMYHVYKPNPQAYLAVCDVLNVEPNEVMLVTANKDFGDIEGSSGVGMTPMLIRDPSSPIANIKELAIEFGLL